MIGRTISHYRVEEKVGAGGMGIVYRAHDAQLERDVALKVLPPGTLTDETARKRFRKEALSLAQLNHPNIATVHEFATEGNIDFIVTEYIAGLTLDSKLAGRALAPKVVLELGKQLVQGLSCRVSRITPTAAPRNLRGSTQFSYQQQALIIAAYPMLTGSLKNGGGNLV
jgi:eukaryotic-like serine/threonine-protein kinase